MGFEQVNRNLDYFRIKDLLKEHFQNLAETELQELIAQEGKIYRFEAGDTIMDFGSYIKLVPLVTNGSIKVMREDDDGHELFLYFIQAGDTCSMSMTCCMMNKKSIIKTVAEEETELIGIPIQFPDQWMTRFQSWKNFILLSYDDKMYTLIKSIDEIAFKKMDERLLSYLEKTVNATHSDTLHITHQQIALDLNASREAISILLKRLEKEGLVELGRNQIKMLEADSLSLKKA